jgi:hypothetical protein
VIVRISGEGQYELDDASCEELKERERKVIADVEEGRSDDFAPAYAALLEDVRSGRKVDDDELVPSDVILPPADITFAEAGQEFTGEGLIPGS